MLDTNVLSELMKLGPTSSVIRWVDSQPASSLFTTTITQAEILYGLRLLPAGKRRKSFESIVESMFAVDLGGRILPFGGDAARAYAIIAAERQRKGRPIAQFDAQIAGIAQAHGAVIATRNVRDFEGCGVQLINPWDS